MGIIISLIIAGVAGWLAGKIMKGGGFGVLANILIGIVGGFIGNAILFLLGLPPSNIIGRLIAATVGAVVLIYVIDIVRKRGTSRV